MKKIRQNYINDVVKLKFNLKMRLTVLLIILSLFRINASTYSQNTKISLNVKNSTVEKVFDLIQQKTEFKVFFKESEVNTQRKISLTAINKRVEYILDRIFKNTSVTYKIVDKQIVLVKKTAKTTTPKQPQSAAVVPQNGFEINGIVTDKTGFPIPGTTISVEGTSNGVVADFDGNFTIRVSVSDILKIENLGFETQKITITSKSKKNYTIVLQESVEALDEVLITDGYKKVDRRLFAGVATKLNLEDVKIDGVSDASRLLEGRDAGVVVDNVSGSFGASPRIRIRGNTSLNGNNNPIWVVDGVILEDNVELNQGDLASGDINSLIGSSIAGLNPDDIKSFSILKDASATALYGARAKNGVIVITTKKGKKGALSVNYSNNFSYRLRPRYTNFNVLNSQQELSVYAELVDKGLIDLTTAQRAESYGVLGQYYNLRRTNDVEIGANGELADSYFDRYQVANTDWFKTLFNDFSLQQNHSLSISGGGDDAVYYFSLSYLNDEGQTIGDDAQRYTTKLSTRFNLTDKFSVGTTLTGSFRDQRAPGTNDRSLNVLTGEFEREFEINPYDYSLTNSRSVTPFDENGNLEFFRKNYAPFNIIHELQNNYINIDVTDISFQTDLDYKITNNLTANSTINYRKAITRREHIIGDKSNQAEAFRADEGVLANINPFLYQDRDNLTRPPFSILPEGGINIYNEDVLDYFYWRNSISWNPQINDIHQFTFLLGQEIKTSNRESREFNGIGISYENGYLVNTNPDAIDQLIDNGDQYFEIANFRDRFAGFFFNGGYTFDNKYTINGTLRYDGSNLQGSSPKSRYLTNYNISGAWNIDKENFFKADWVNLLKLKGTYGLSGGRGPSNASASLDLRGRVPLRPQDVESTIEINSLENVDLTFEKLKEFSTGLEFALFNNRVAGELGYYRRDAFDLIGDIKTSGIGGQAFKRGNYADIEVEGYEFALSTVNVKTKNFEWSTNLNVGYNTEEVKELRFDPRLVDLISASGAPFTGREISALYSVRFAGLNEFGIPTFFDADDNRVTNIDLQSRDDIEKILVYEGPTQPRGAGGFNNTFKYKGFTLSANVSFKFDYKIRLNSNFAATYTDFNSLPGELVNRWVLPGDENVTNIPAIIENRTLISELNAVVNPNGLVVGGDNAYELYNNSDLRVVDGTYARMRSIALGYTIPSNYAERLGIASARIRLQGENLFLLYSDKGLNGQDPEFFNSGGAALPVPKTVTLSLNVGF
ncbi:SusC/RagA family TonB-linked outer membrane protein [Aquimarina mytili]|uniref:SusC/RagA family TonB-linked outer membrane protein n=1 Tax=Aquimarina mytili TaxID=874423 RepID=A0A936ZY51_9FLAO|nr:SusC/RagA family TonB-linked outer membrane protein [Aquimarina mytili]MBL0684456.1 SusC/RagA family TonB-linked outer membrane protein [Aquimarina mytili]